MAAWGVGTETPTMPAAPPMERQRVAVDAVAEAVGARPFDALGLLAALLVGAIALLVTRKLSGEHLAEA